jgi:RNA polymerase primary sigma factor
LGVPHLDHAQAACAPFESYLSEVNRTPLLSADAEKDLAYRIEAGDPAARDEMVRANLRLVICIARQYVGKGVALEDLIEEGNLGLLRAVEGFDPEMNSRFSTYASYWVKQSIRVALNKSGHAVRLPQYMGTLLGKWWRAETQLRDELGRDASREEVTAHLGLTARQVRAVAKGQKAVTSGRAVGVAGKERPAELLADLGAGPTERLMTEDSVRAALDSLDKLGDREATILRLRFGLGGGEPATLQEVGEQLGLTRERVRQIEQTALADLRNRLNA